MDDANKDTEKKLSFYRVMVERLASSTYQFQNHTKRIKYDNSVQDSSLSNNNNTTNININDINANQTLKRKSPIMHMPTEIVQKIFCYIDYECLGVYKLVNIITSL